jgi:hypothetical protein
VRQASSAACPDPLPSNTYTVEVLAVPATPTITASATAVCQGTDVVFNVANPVAGATYTWSSNAGGTASGTGNSTCTVSGATSGEKNVSVYVSEASKGVTCRSGDANAMKTTVVQVPDTPEGVTYSVSNVMCGIAMTLEIKNSSPNFGYDWYYGGQVEKTRTLGSQVTNTWLSLAPATYVVAAYAQLGEFYCYGTYRQEDVNPDQLSAPRQTASCACCEYECYNSHCVYQNSTNLYKPYRELTSWMICDQDCKAIGGNILSEADAEWRSLNVVTDTIVWSASFRTGFINGADVYAATNGQGECMCYKW